MLRLIKCFVLCVVIVGCASREYSLPLNIQLSELPDGHGVLLLSSGADKHSISFATAGVIEPFESNKDVASFHIDNYAIKSHFNDHIGFVHAFPLPEGKYEVIMKAINPYMQAYNPSPLPSFEIKSGEYLYIGEIYLVDSKDLYIVNDQLERDIKLLSRNSPDITVEKVNVRLLNK